jgi:hypothetical protein
MTVRTSCPCIGLLVMGAYSHSRLREMLLGGLARHMLKNEFRGRFFWRTDGPR